MADKIFGLALLCLGLFMIYSGLSDDFSVGEQVHSTLKRGSRVISESVREYGYFDVFKRQIIPIIFGGLLFFVGYSMLKE